MTGHLNVLFLTIEINNFFQQYIMVEISFCRKPYCLYCPKKGNAAIAFSCFVYLFSTCGSLTRVIIHLFPREKSASHVLALFSRVSEQHPCTCVFRFCRYCTCAFFALNRRGILRQKSNEKKPSVIFRKIPLIFYTKKHTAEFSSR